MNSASSLSQERLPQQQQQQPCGGKRSGSGGGGFGTFNHRAWQSVSSRAYLRESDRQPRRSNKDHRQSEWTEQKIDFCSISLLRQTRETEHRQSAS